MKTGWRIQLQTTVSSFSCQITDCTPPGATRASIDVSHTMTTSVKDFIPGDLVDWGEMKVTIGFSPTMVPPIDQAKESMILTFRDGEKWTFMGFLTGYVPKAPLDDKMTAEVTIKVCSKPVIS